jgi:hypothetical protein
MVPATQQHRNVTVLATPTAWRTRLLAILYLLATLVNRMLLSIVLPVSMELGQSAAAKASVSGTTTPTQLRANAMLELEATCASCLCVFRPATPTRHVTEVLESAAARHGGLLLPAA